MKKYYLLLLIIVLSSCSNNDSEPNDTKAQESLKGRWNWVKSTRELSDIVLTPTSQNRTIVLEFSGNSYKTYENGKLLYNRKFSVVKKPSVYGGEKNMFVIEGLYSLTSKPSQFAPTYINSFEIIGDKLYIREEAPHNGIIEEYDRVK
ncbi:hypothetical protein RB619_08685 [Flavobacterium sp. LHD-80]|uniref:hypothetical protein n=1 Tax=Flavobacterium sp. LHD-80 TaxID=3071411 RepID=UPI0027E0BD48|nr:hypothetical protein [Flavobacterium sp. LHD-80]MDQ6470714.1 hypothetical protein [Flavobacterium sp. LHD-80]